MGYNVDGFLVVDEKTLINPWNFKGIFAIYPKFVYFLMGARLKCCNYDKSERRI